jgi:hypothetical protein
MNRWLKGIVVAVLIIIIGFAAYFSLRPDPTRFYVTGDAWAESVWNADVPPSFAEFKNGVFNATVSQSSKEFFGGSLIQQGDNPHGGWNSTAKLKREITFYRSIVDAQYALIIDFVGKRNSPIEWFDNNESNRANNIGILLVGDFGGGYYNPDTSEARALLIDIWLDNNPAFSSPVHWQGVEGVESDYHSGFPAKNMIEVDKQYAFKFRVDGFIMDSLEHWGLEQFTLKMVQCYIEAKASKASLEATRIIITT